MSKRHYIGMCGLSGGYMPNYCDVFDTKGSAAESLGQIYDLSERKIKLLRRDMYIEVEKYEYCSIDECTCNEPWIHSEMSEEEYRQENS